MASAASNSGSYSPQYDFGFGSANTALNKYLDEFKNNETAVGLGVGTRGDWIRTQGNMALDLNYQRNVLGMVSDYTYGLENLKAGNALNLLQAEGGIARDLANIQGGYQIKGKQLDLEGTKFSAEKVAQASMYSADKTAQASNYRADKDLEGTRFTAQTNLEGRRYEADQGLAGIKYNADSSERRIGLQGQQDRLALQEKTNQEKELRRDARGAIRSQGARFFA